MDKILSLMSRLRAPSLSTVPGRSTHSEATDSSRPEWTQGLAALARTPEGSRSPEMNALVLEGVVPSESSDDLNLLVNECLDRHEEALLKVILANVPLRTLKLHVPFLAREKVQLFNRAISPSASPETVMLLSGVLEEDQIKQLSLLLDKTGARNLVLSESRPRAENWRLLTNVILNEPRLTSFKLWSRTFGFVPELCAVLCEILEKKPGMIELDVLPVFFSAEHFALVTKAALDPNSKLRCLKLSGCPQQVVDVKSLAGYLRHNAALQVLALLGATLVAPDFEHLIEALAINTTLGDLSLTACVIQDRAKLDLARLIEQGSLHTLSLRESEVGDASVLPMMEALKGNTKLRCLDISGTRAGTPSIVGLAAALRVNRSLVELRLPELTSEALEALRDSMAHNPTIQILSFEKAHEKIADDRDLINDIQDHISRNRTLLGPRLAFAQAGMDHFLSHDSEVNLTGLAAGHLSNGLALSVASVSLVNREALGRAQQAYEARVRADAEKGS